MEEVSQPSSQRVSYLAWPIMMVVNLLLELDLFIGKRDSLGW